ncbi:MAG TPA: four helix bundle protein [Chloroflexota bacterium]|nr:four helix bundle protein [Chloroflexota bacterium]
MNYQEWEQAVFAEIKGDVLWKVEAYRLALFVADIGWYDVSRLINDARTVKLSDQLYRALGSIGANTAEGYSRSSGKDRARFYEYALGSARESRVWYFNARHILGEPIVHHRTQLLTQIIRLLTTMIPQQRGNVVIRDTKPIYNATDAQANHPDPAEMADPAALPHLLQNIPLP